MPKRKVKFKGLGWANVRCTSTERLSNIIYIIAGFSHILAEAGTEDVRQVLTESLGFREVASVPYATFSVGDTDFASLSKLEPTQFTRLSLMKRAVPSNLY